MRWTVLAAVLTVAVQAWATEQRPDLVIDDGVAYELRPEDGGFPLEMLWPNRKDKPPLRLGPGGEMNTACWRGYVAVWEIDDGVLYLKGLLAWHNEKPADLKELFKDRIKDGRVKAEWYTGSVRLSGAQDWSRGKEPGTKVVKLEKGVIVRPATAPAGGGEK